MWMFTQGYLLIIDKKIQIRYSMGTNMNPCRENEMNFQLYSNPLEPFETKNAKNSHHNIEKNYQAR
jgi:hypothetical protein